MNQQTKNEEKFPWWMPNFLRPYEQSGSNYLVRCSCGRALWLLSSPKVRKHHVGHEMTPLVHGGSVWEFIKMKMGWLDNRTLSEWFQDFAEGRN